MRSYENLIRICHREFPLRIATSGHHVHLCDHIANFLGNGKQFEAAIGLLEAVLRRRDHLVVCSIEDANHKLLQLLRVRMLRRPLAIGVELAEVGLIRLDLLALGSISQRCMQGSRTRSVWVTFLQLQEIFWLSQVQRALFLNSNPKHSSDIFLARIQRTMSNQQFCPPLRTCFRGIVSSKLLRPAGLLVAREGKHQSISQPMACRS